jgi:hypothetical protein
MLAIDGKRVMEVTQEHPGPRIGWILHALLEEVLYKPTRKYCRIFIKRSLNWQSYLTEKYESWARKGRGEKKKSRKTE